MHAMRSRLAANRLRTSALVLTASGFLLAGCAATKSAFNSVLGLSGPEVSEETLAKRTTIDGLMAVPPSFDRTGKQLAALIAFISGRLAEAPAPGEVTLGDLSPELASFQGTDLDFITKGKECELPERFQYLRIGVPEYDQFFQSVAELHALAFQARFTVARTREVCNALLDRADDPTVAITALLSSALGVNPVNASSATLELMDKLRGADELIEILEVILPAFEEKGKAVADSAEALWKDPGGVLDDPAIAITSMHIVTAIKESAALVLETVDLLGQTVQEITNVGT